MIATTPAAIIKIARLLYLEARYAVPQIESAASVLGGTVILEYVNILMAVHMPGETYNCAFHVWNPSPAIIVG